MSFYDQDPKNHDLGEDSFPLRFSSFNTVQDLEDDQVLGYHHEEFIDPILKYIFPDSEYTKSDWGDEIPLVPKLFFYENGTLKNIQEGSRIAKLSAEFLLENWSAEKVYEYDDELIHLTDWRIANEETLRQEFVRVRLLKFDPGQQTRASIYTEKQPAKVENILPAVEQKAGRIAKVFSKLR